MCVCVCFFVGEKRKTEISIRETHKFYGVEVLSDMQKYSGMHRSEMMTPVDKRKITAYVSCAKRPCFYCDVWLEHGNSGHFSILPVVFLYFLKYFRDSS